MKLLNHLHLIFRLVQKFPILSNNATKNNFEIIIFIIGYVLLDIRFQNKKL
jgi:hypothetical protein